MVKKVIKKTMALAAKSNTKINNSKAKSNDKSAKSPKTQHAKALVKKTANKKALKKSATIVATDSTSSKKVKNSSASVVSTPSTNKKSNNKNQPKTNNTNQNNATNKNNNKTEKSAAADSSDSTNIVKLIEKGGAAVDHEVPHAQDYYVLPDPQNEFNGKHFCATLNMSDLKNNNNKFYLIQILVNAKTKEVHFWNRWGRVGYSGQNSINKCQSAEAAKKIFLKKYNEKTGKGYEKLEIDYANEVENKRAEKEKTDKDKKNGKSKDVKNKEDKKLVFDEQVKSLLNLIYDLQLMNQQMKEIGYDANKMPLGKLSQHMIKEGYEVLREIEQVLNKTKKGDLYELSSRFYTIIPHNFGYQ